MTPAERRAALVEKVARAMCSDFGGPRECNSACPCCIQDATAALTVALEEAAKAAYSPMTQRYVAGNERDENGFLAPGSPYDRGRYDAAAAIRALIKEAQT
jgi:hypothetical protein